jgi:hypothetical protein
MALSFLAFLISIVANIVFFIKLKRNKDALKKDDVYDIIRERSSNIKNSINSLNDRVTRLESDNRKLSQRIDAIEAKEAKEAKEPKGPKGPKAVIPGKTPPPPSMVTVANPPTATTPPTPALIYLDVNDGKLTQVNNDDNYYYVAYHNPNGTYSFELKCASQRLVGKAINNFTAFCQAFCETTADSKEPNESTNFENVERGILDTSFAVKQKIKIRLS